MKKVLMLFFVLALASSFAKAATITGSIYDLSISKVTSAVVEADSVPKQRNIAVNGTYGLDLPIGNYTISAFAYKGGQKMQAKENITIIDDGIYILDLLLYPDFSDEENLSSDADLRIEDPYDKEAFKADYALPLLIILGVILVFAFLTSLVFYYRRSKAFKPIPSEDDDLMKMRVLLSKNQGRMTQKDIRKEFFLSEAKISLLIAQLESEGKVKKIKKGRGNIIVLVK